MKRIALALLCLCSFAFPARGQSPAQAFSYLSATSNNSTLIHNQGAVLQDLVAVNTTGTTYYLKLYNKPTAPTCGTDTPYWRLPIAANSTLPLTKLNLHFPPNGIGFCLVAGLADNDNTNAATGVVLNFGVERQ